MEISTSFLFAVEVLVAAVTAILFAARFLPKRKQTIKQEQPSKWPVIGHLHLLLRGGAVPLHAKLAALADRYGPVMRFSLGSKPTIIVSDASAARECLATNDLAFASRPRIAVGEILGFDFTSFGWSPYGESWRELRKICTLELLSARRLEATACIRDEETRHCVRELNKLSGKGEQGKVEVREHLVDLVLRMIMRMIAGRNSSSFGHDEEAKELKEITEEAFVLAGVPNIGDSLPFLKWLDLQGTQKAMKRVAGRIDSMAQSWLDRRVKMMEEKKEEGSEESADFIDVLFAVGKDNKYLASLSPEHRNLTIKANLMLMVLASLDTTSVTLEWALASLLAHPEAMRRSQGELDKTVGRERMVEESDIQNLPYLQAVVKETLRLHPAGPLLVPHESKEECVVAGSRVSSGTRLFVNAWKIHRDPTLWKMPLEFEPDRFLGESDAQLDFRGRNFQYIPFGSGRRICPGISLALSVLHLSLARLLHSFDFKNPDGDSSKVDMREGMGLSCPKLFPLEVILVPRLPSQLY